MHIPWILPFEKETLEDYATRLTKDISMNDAIFIGLSFGGIIALEVAQRLKVSQLIIISSVKTQIEIPFYFKLLRLVPLHHWIPASLITKPNFITRWLFGVNTSEEIALLEQVMTDMDIAFFRWAVNSIIHWENEAIPANTVHIHGSADRIFPLRFVSPSQVIPRGGHFFVFSQPTEISELINSFL